ncbi:MAG: bifunctional phosphopantothenoylcysteine decarboxylase/phosphopantothenate--cysteine ligase CoaBC [Chloroflexota bacterium]|nr:bifunctional phosphopantothenoylcysteine decarboxylase/phosphopantothenate--cysteine ligase CoaBC [Chloroflexota bacterium]
MFPPDSSPVERVGLSGARIVLGVTGGIAAYKAAELASTLVQAGVELTVVMTNGARKFIQPLTFEGLTHRRVYTGVFEGWGSGHTGHVELAAGSDLLLIAPATANTVARLAQGNVDDMLSAIALVTQAPIVVAPAMEHHMWNHPATIANVQILQDRGVAIVGPASGRLASGATGQGRLASTAEIVRAVRSALGRGGPLAGKSVVITAGGTQEAIDPVRFIGNRSSGQMGIALAEAAIDAGAAVRLIATRNLDPSSLIGDVVVVESALDMQRAVESALPTADILIMAAAVADFRLDQVATQKIRKQPGQETLDLHLVRNPDIIAGVTRAGLVKVGFAAETEHLVDHASAKLRAKGLDLIVANDAVATIGSERSQATLITRNAEPVRLPDAPKAEVAARIIEELVRLVDRRSGHA